MKMNSRKRGEKTMLTFHAGFHAIVWYFCIWCTQDMEEKALKKKRKIIFKI